MCVCVCIVIVRCDAHDGYDLRLLEASGLRKKINIDVTDLSKLVTNRVK